MKYLSSMKPKPGVDNDEIALENRNMNYTFLSSLYFHHHYIQQQYFIHLHQPGQILACMVGWQEEANTNTNTKIQIQIKNTNKQIPSTWIECGLHGWVARGCALRGRSQVPRLHTAYLGLMIFMNICNCISRFSTIFSTTTTTKNKGIRKPVSQ